MPRPSDPILLRKSNCKLLWLWSACLSISASFPANWWTSSRVTHRMCLQMPTFVRAGAEALPRLAVRVERKDKQNMALTYQSVVFLTYTARSETVRTTIHTALEVLLKANAQVYLQSAIFWMSNAQIFFCLNVSAENGTAPFLIHLTCSSEMAVNLKRACTSFSYFTSFTRLHLSISQKSKPAWWWWSVDTWTKYANIDLVNKQINSFHVSIPDLALHLCWKLADCIFKALPKDLLSFDVGCYFN